MNSWGVCRSARGKPSPASVSTVLQRANDIITLTSEQLRALSLEEVRDVLGQMGLPTVETADAGITLMMQHAIELR